MLRTSRQINRVRVAFNASRSKHSFVLLDDMKITPETPQFIVGKKNGFLPRQVGINAKRIQLFIFQLLLHFVNIIPVCILKCPIFCLIIFIDSLNPFSIPMLLR